MSDHRWTVVRLCGEDLLAFRVGSDELRVTPWDMYELPGVVVTTMGEDGISEAFAALVATVERDAQVRGILAMQGDDFTCRYCPGTEQIAALYTEDNQ